MGSSDKTVTDVFDLLLGIYDVDVSCSTDPVVGQINGLSDNPSLVASFEAVPWAYERTPGGLHPGQHVTLATTFDTYADTGCDFGADKWRISLYDQYGEFLLASTPYVDQATLTSTFDLVLQGGT